MEWGWCTEGQEPSVSRPYGPVPRLLSLRAAVGSPGCEQQSLLAGGLAEGQCVSHLSPSVDCPWGPGLRGTAQRFQNGIRSAAAAGRKRRGGKGRRPASWAVLRWALASSCLCCECGSTSEWVSPRWRARCRCPLGLGRVLLVSLSPGAHPGASGWPLLGLMG